MAESKLQSQIGSARSRRDLSGSGIVWHPLRRCGRLRTPKAPRLRGSLEAANGTRTPRPSAWQECLRRSPRRKKCLETSTSHASRTPCWEAVILALFGPGVEGSGTVLALVLTRWSCGSPVLDVGSSVWMAESASVVARVGVDDVEDCAGGPQIYTRASATTAIGCRGQNRRRSLARPSAQTGNKYRDPSAAVLSHARRLKGSRLSTTRLGSSVTAADGG